MPVVEAVLPPFRCIKGSTVKVNDSKLILLIRSLGDQIEAEPSDAPHAIK